MPFEPNQSPAGPEFENRPDRIRFRAAARNLAANPAGRLEFRRAHHAALEIVQSPQERAMPDRALNVACPDRFQAALLASSGAMELRLPARMRHPAMQYRRIRRPPRMPHNSDAVPGETAGITVFSNASKGQLLARRSSHTINPIRPTDRGPRGRAAGTHRPRGREVHSYRRYGRSRRPYLLRADNSWRPRQNRVPSGFAADNRHRSATVRPHACHETSAMIGPFSALTRAVCRLPGELHTDMQPSRPVQPVRPAPRRVPARPAGGRIRSASA